MLRFSCAGVRSGGSPASAPLPFPRPHQATARSSTARRTLHTFSLSSLSARLDTRATAATNNSETWERNYQARGSQGLLPTSSALTHGGNSAPASRPVRAIFDRTQMAKTGSKQNLGGKAATTRIGKGKVGVMPTGKG